MPQAKAHVSDHSLHHHQMQWEESSEAVQVYHHDLQNDLHQPSRTEVGRHRWRRTRILEVWEHVRSRWSHHRSECLKKEEEADVLLLLRSLQHLLLLLRGTGHQAQ
jgi:hypothetical protein